MGEPVNHFRDDYGYLTLRATNSEFYNGGIGGYVMTCYFTNCLMDRMGGSQIYGFPGNAFIMRNCTWHGGTVTMNPVYTNIPISFKDCAFDATAFVLDAAYYTNATVDCDYNAFLNTVPTNRPVGAHDVFVTNFNWQTSFLSSYYLPTNSALTNAGSRNATNAGLYHFCTTTNQVKETNSIVDIGVHWVALTNGVAIDTDGDGLADYIEDANGDGYTQTTEWNWNNADTDSDGVSDYIEWLQGRKPNGSKSDCAWIIADHCIVIERETEISGQFYS